MKKIEKKKRQKVEKLFINIHNINRRMLRFLNSFIFIDEQLHIHTLLESRTHFL